MPIEQAVVAMAYRPQDQARMALASQALNNIQVLVPSPPMNWNTVPTIHPTTLPPRVRHRAYGLVSNGNVSASFIRQVIRKIQSMQRTKMHTAYRMLCTELIQQVTGPSDPMPVARLLENLKTADSQANQDWDLITGLGLLVQDYLTRNTIEMLQFPNIETWFGQSIARMCGVEAGTASDAAEWDSELRDQVIVLDLEVVERTESVLKDLQLLSISAISPIHVLESVGTSVSGLIRTFEDVTPGVLTEFITTLHAVQETITA